MLVSQFQNCCLQLDLFRTLGFMLLDCTDSYSAARVVYAITPVIFCRLGTFGLLLVPVSAKFFVWENLQLKSVRQKPLGAEASIIL